MNFQLPKSFNSKALVAIILGVSILISGCGRLLSGQTTNNSDKQGKLATINDFKISADYYQTVLPFEPSKSRGQIVSTVKSRVDLNELETGLMRLSQDTFPTEKYFFKEGKYLTKSDIQSWLVRKYSEAQLEEKKLTAEKNLGLNPENESEPEYLATILEQNYVYQEEDKLKLGGVSIALGLNTVSYSSSDDLSGIPIAPEVVLEKGKEMGAEVVRRLRSQAGLEKVPIVVALYAQAPLGTILPGNFIARSQVPSTELSISNWVTLDEKNYLFSSAKASAEKTFEADRFDEFKKEVGNYFPNFNGLSGRAFYKDGVLEKMVIAVTMQFYGESEVIGFTQFIAGKLDKYFEASSSVEVIINSARGQEALISRKKGASEPFVYIYE